MHFTKQVGVSSLYSGKSKKTGEPYHRIQITDAQNWKSISLFLSKEQMERVRKLEITEGDLIDITINLRPTENAFRVDVIDFEPVLL